jgi:hypothetical protein
VTYADQIRTEANAKSMRSLIANGIEENKAIAYDAKEKATDAQNRVNNIINSQDGQTPVEVIDGRYDEINNKTYNNLGERLNVFSASLNDIVTINVSQYGAKGDGVTDDTLAIKNAIGNGTNIRKVIFSKKTYCISSTIIIPPYVDVDFNGCSIKAINGGTFINNYMFAVNSSDCVTWTFPYYPRVGEFTNVWLEGNGVANIRGIFLCSNHRVTKVHSNNLYNTIYSPNVYIDNYFLQDIKIVVPLGTDWQINKRGQGDGLTIERIVAPSDIGTPCNLLSINQCGGGRISDITNGNIEVWTSYAVSLRHLHLELGTISIYDSNISISDSIIYKRNEVTTSPIIIKDADYATAPSNTKKSKPVILDNVVLFHYYFISDYTTDLADIDLTNFKGVVNIRNCYRRIANNGLVRTTICGISLFDGTNIFYNKYDFTIVRNKKIIQTNDNCPSSLVSYVLGINNDTNLSWKKASGIYYYKVCCINDSILKIGRNTTTETTFTATSNGCNIVLDEIDSNSIVRIYRGTTSGTYNEYVDIPNALYTVFDNGISANGYAWKSITPVSTPDVQNTITGCISNAGLVIARGTSTPTIGTWSTGDIIYSTSSTEQGTAGSKYIVIGWQCVAGGTPGTWLQMRTLTGN